MSFVVRTDGDPVRLASAARQAIWSVDRDQSVARVTELQRLVDGTLGERRMTAVLLGVFAALAAGLAGLGAALGLAGSVALAKLLATQLYGVQSTDPMTYAVVTALLFLITLAAVALPAWRAARVDPLVALAHE